MNEVVQKILGLGAVKLICLAVVFATGYVVFLGGSPVAQATENPFANAAPATAEDAIAQYEIVKSSGDQAQAAAMSAWVSQIYLMNKNAAEYNRWKAISEGHKAALYNQMMKQNAAAAGSH